MKIFADTRRTADASQSPPSGALPAVSPPALPAAPEASANLFAALRAAFPSDLEACAIETETGAPYSWRDLDAATARIANLLLSLQLAPGARVAAQVDKSVEAAMLYLATLRSGHVFVPLNTAYQQSEMSHFITDAEPEVLVCAAAARDALEPLARGAGTRHVFTLEADGSGSLMDAAASLSDRHESARVEAGTLAAIIYTSGTTGRSKGAMLSHGNLLSNARVLQTHWRWQSDDVLIHALPIFHVHGLFVALHGALINGSKMIWLSRFDAATAVRQLRRATVFMGVPTLYVRMLREPALDAAAAAGMRLFISGSAPLLPDTFNAWRQRTGHTILERYGMSETVMLTSNPCAPEDGHRRRGTVGRALPGVGVRIAKISGGASDAVIDTTGAANPRHADANGAGVAGGATLAEIGGVEVRGPGVFLGYWRMPEKTREEFTPDGWFRTGDVGHLDAEGFLTIVGRSKDVIISGGYNVYPAEVEEALNAMPGVLESAVVGVPDADFGEVGVAVVVGRPEAELDPAQLLLALRSQLAAYKVPKSCVVQAELPRNAMGKVQKNALRATCAPGMRDGPVARSSG